MATTGMDEDEDEDMGRRWRRMGEDLEMGWRAKAKKKCKRRWRRTQGFEKQGKSDGAGRDENFVIFLY